MKYRLTETKLSGKDAVMVQGVETTEAGNMILRDFEASTSENRAVGRFVSIITDDIRDAINDGKTVNLAIE